MSAPGARPGRTPGRGGRRGPGWRTWLLVALLVVPVLELALVIRVGEWIGVWPTVALLVGESLIGAWLLGREGPQAWRRLRGALGAGRMPTDELLDGALILVGGTLLLTPGFLTDAVGFLLVLPPTRPLVRRLLRSAVGRRLTAGLWVSRGGRPGPVWPPGPGGRPPRPGGAWSPGRRGGEVIEGEVLPGPDDDPRRPGETPPTP